jgi:hypothetical protein
MIGQIPWWAWIPMLAILFGGLSGLYKMRCDHVERMEKIRMGIDPDGQAATGKAMVPPEV